MQMTLSVAKPRKRTDTEVDEAWSQFKLAWKEALVGHTGKHKGKWERKWIRDVFGENENLKNHLKTGIV